MNDSGATMNLDSSWLRRIRTRKIVDNECGTPRSLGVRIFQRASEIDAANKEAIPVESESDWRDIRFTI